MSGLIRYVTPLAFVAWRLQGPALALAWTGAGAAVLGLLIALWARFSLGRNWSGVVTLKEGHELVTSGPYAVIRHPIYTALLLLFLALALFIHTPGAYLGFLAIVWSCWVKLRQEEVLMLGQFPDSYPAYMARTKRLIPLLV
jgi:protein-S-isoprenylcysteine O-methyltransferase Ste14